MPADEPMEVTSGSTTVTETTDSSNDFTHKQNVLRTVLGISDSSKPAGMEETLPIIEALTWSLDETSLSTQDDVTATIENLLHHVLSEIQPPKDTGMDVDSEKLGEVFNCGYLDTVASTKAFVAIKYFLSILNRLEKINKHAGSHNEYYGYLKLGFESFFITFLRGYTASNIPTREIWYSFTRLMLTDKINSNLLDTIVNFALNEDLTDSDCLADVFNPILDVLRLCVTCSNLSQNDDMTMERPFYIVKSLLNIKLHTSRPFADLIASRPDFCPKGYTGHRGRELSKMSFLGPFLAMGVCDIEGENHLYAGADRYFDVEYIPNDDTRFKAYDVYQGRMNNYRRLMGDIIHPLLVNASTRERALDYISALLKMNKKRAQIQADDSKLATDAFMVNLMCVLLSLSEKITLDKVVPTYIFHPKARIDVKDETRLKATSEEVEEYTKTLDLNYEPRFPTDCFFMTIQAIHIGANALIQSLKRVKRHLHQLQQVIKEMEAQLKDITGIKRDRLTEKLKFQKSNRDRVVRTMLCMECTLRDRNILDRVLMFSDRQLSFLISMVSPNFQQNYEIPDEPPKMFQMYPEFYLETVLDFVVYVLHSYPQLLLELHLNLPQQLLMFLCATHYFNNPFLAAKVVDVVYSICPEVNPPMEGLHYSLVNTPLAINRLVPSMIKFYSDVESGTDFYEKFNIRRSMQVIFRSLWKMPIYRSKICEIASQCKDEFIRFVNMVINDATYLLDESLANLKKIHDVEAKMASPAWANLSDEERQRETDTLSEAQRGVRSWLVMSDDTMDMFGYLTKDVPKPFYLDPLGDRVASMLDHNLSELCGPKCTDLKVKDAQKRFHWDPRRLLEQIVEVFLNLASEEFAEAIAGDERSYSPETFDIACNRIKNVLPISQSERFKNLSEAVKTKWEEKQKREEDYGDDIPDDFVDPLMSTLMLDPVKLPSGIIIDRKVILRHFLTDQSDPFNRRKCTPEDLIPVPELKARIEEWIQERRSKPKK